MATTDESFATAASSSPLLPVGRRTWPGIIGGGELGGNGGNAGGIGGNAGGDCLLPPPHAQHICIERKPASSYLPHHSGFIR
mmetsp:Transcript_37410/g.94915  ORF Transcript_37410/g.94915 Transcript_37410/m.94915 type:complete len:82 (+) Transcript_37410:4502-4747(+)